MSRKDLTPQETIEKIEGILRGIGLTYTITSELNNCDMFFSVRLEIHDNGFLVGANGKGMTRELALASGLAELMERLQSRNGLKFWYSTKDYPEKAFIHEYLSDSDLEEPIKADFAEFANSRMYQYRIDYTNVKDNSKISVPNRLVNLVCGSNGLCAGNGKSEAIVQGACEIFERYIRKIISRDHIRCPYIRKEGLLRFPFYGKMRCVEEAGYIWELIDCSYNGRFPVVGLIILDRKKSRYAIALGSDVDFEISVERCITELLQGHDLKQLSMHMRPIDFRVIENDDVDWQVEKQSDYYDFVDNYISNHGKNPFYLFLETERVKVPAIFRNFENNEDAFQYLLHILDANHLPLYYADFSYLGFPTYRVYIPRLSRVFEMKQESFAFIDNLKENLSLMMRISDLSDDEKQQLVENLVDYSQTYTNRRNAFNSILFRFYGNKDFDFNYLYLDFVIALLYLSLRDYKKARMHYTRFFAERSLFESSTANELLRVIYMYVSELANDLKLDDIRIKGSVLFNRNTNQYVYEFIKKNKSLSIVYWPNCPNCESCSYRKECAYEEWKHLNIILREKQKNYYLRKVV